MRKISLMYFWSGGTRYDKTCGDCRHLKHIQVGKRSVYKCECYGISGSVATDWKKSYVACKNFNKAKPKEPVSGMGVTRAKRNKIVDGQLNIMDFIT